MLKRSMAVFLSVILAIMPLELNKGFLRTAFAAEEPDELETEMTKWQEMLGEDDLDELLAQEEDFTLVQETTDEIVSYLLDLYRYINIAWDSIEFDFETIEQLNDCPKLTDAQCCILAQWERQLREYQSETQRFKNCFESLHSKARRTLVDVYNKHQKALQREYGNIKLQFFFDALASISSSCLTILSFKEELKKLAKGKVSIKDIKEEMKKKTSKKELACSSYVYLKTKAMSYMLQLIIDELGVIKNSYIKGKVNELGEKVIEYITKLILVLGGMKDMMENPKGEAVDSIVGFIAEFAVDYITKVIEAAYQRTEAIVQRQRNVLSVNYFALRRQIIAYERVAQKVDEILNSLSEKIFDVQRRLRDCRPSSECEICQGCPGLNTTTVARRPHTEEIEGCYRRFERYIAGVTLCPLYPCPKDVSIPPTGDQVQTSDDQDVSQPPKPDDVSQPPKSGDPTGTPGPIIVIDCIKNGVVIIVYDPLGRPVDIIHRESFQSNERVLHDAIRQARNGGGGRSPLIPIDPSNLQSALGDVMVLKPDVTDQQINEIADGLKDSFERKRDCEKFCDFVKQAPGVDFTEKNRKRDDQKEEITVTPNDPFYFDAVGHKGVWVSFNANDIKTDVPSDRNSVSLSRQTAHKVDDQWGLHAIGFTPYEDSNSAWHLVDAKKKNTIVAVIDSGFDMTHPDAPKFFWTNPKEKPNNGKDDDKNGYIDDIHGWNFLEENHDLTDRKGHGTFVTGIIAAQANNGIAISGVNPGAQIMVLKVGNEEGKASSVNIYRALVYAADHGAKVINISLGSLGRSKLEQRGIDYAYSKGCVIVVAAGNYSQDILSYGPPAARNVLSVASIDPAGVRVWSSNTGANVAIAAPGRSIYSLYSRDSKWPGPTAEMKNLCYKAEGTSFAAPFVAGTASLLLAVNPKLTPQDVEGILLDTATDLEDKGWDPYTGAGFLNAYGALSYAKGRPLTARFMDIVINKEKKKVTNVDVYGVIRGDTARYTVELVKGTKSDKWEKILESPGTVRTDGFLCRIDAGKLQSGKQWSVRLTAFDKKGNRKEAKMSFSF
ncbi:MAG: S8 family peptidase [Candidatus Omnitrophota bacterium]